MRIVSHHITDSDTLPHPLMPAIPITTSPQSPTLPVTSDNTSGNQPTSEDAQDTADDDQGDTKIQEPDNLPSPRRSTRLRKPAEWYTDLDRLQASKYSYASKVLFVNTLFHSLQTTGTQHEMHHPVNT